MSGRQTGLRELQRRSSARAIEEPRGFARPGRAALERLASRWRGRPLRFPGRLGSKQTAGEAPPPLEVIAFTRAAFGPAPGDLTAFRALGATDEERIEAWVDRQLDPESIHDGAVQQKLSAAGFSTLEKSLTGLWVDHLHPDLDVGVRMRPAWETQRATLLKIIYSERQLAEVLADFWHNHFSVFAWHFYAGPLFVHYDRDVIRAHGLGNFREMLEAVTAAPAMLFYLDNAFSSADGPNENYARELLELHTLGRENYLGAIPAADVPVDGDGVPVGYVDEDVRELARCLTGWSVDESTGHFLYRESWHDDGPKRVLGLDIPAGGPPLTDVRLVLDRLAAHPGVARFVARKLCRRLVADDPPQALVQATADELLTTRDRPDQLRRVVRSVLLSDAFAATWDEKAKRPLEHVLSAVRTMNPTFTLPLDDALGDGFFWLLFTTGQLVHTWEPPTGFPDRREDWLTTNALVGSWRLINLMTDLELDGERPCDIVAATPSGVRTAEELADDWIDRVLGRPLGPASRAEVVALMADGGPVAEPLDPAEPAVANRLRTMVGLLACSPEFLRR